ncbi:hypothetical protein AXK11_06225 [Cephaloticoccus primus]|uniref:UDP-N-acetylenolpyruvoylglucosamine reductase n=1 Tax=Cephaloticoccus primus TaxID=1548207 RepID=A0A139SLQ0_9BACT|nr:UDP-N-acetylmuramate dehydrogenase [Cephaloticoccus primus]KXU35476.1 hypothetical protein AXK11_06225 [Cephaloticoccus primus]
MTGSAHNNNEASLRRALPLLFGEPVRRIHAVGVAGMGLGPLAVYLARCGWLVSGEDDALDKAPPELRERLLEAGVTLGPLPDDCELLVYSSAISEKHAARVSAAARGLPCVRRGELLAEVVRDKRLVAVCGSHGKTTTTAMLAAALRRANFGAGYVLGGLPAQRSFPLAAAGDWIVAEIDESDGTITHFAPEITVCLNLDWDHVDQYRSEAELHAAFGALFQRTKRAVLINARCALSRELAAKASARVFTFGQSRTGHAADFSLEEWNEQEAGSKAGGAQMQQLVLGGQFAISQAVLRAIGAFNAFNATAALAAAQLMGAELSPLLLADFSGVRRRQSLISDLGGVGMIEDYAHHPTEIRVLLGVLRNVLRRSVAPPNSPPRSARLFVVFQPHRYSRTAQFKRELAAALSIADEVFLLDVYGAGEAPSAGATSAELLGEFGAGPAVHYCADDAALFAALDAAACASGDFLAFVGAGDVDRKGREWAAQWRTCWWDTLAAEARARLSPETKLTREEPLARKSTMLVGGAARLYAEPQSVAELQALVRLAHARGVRVFPIGRGSNLIIPDEGVEGLVISLGHPGWATFELCTADAVDAEAGAPWSAPALADFLKSSPAAKTLVRVGAGLRLKNLCGLAAKAGLPGFEFLEGIPGSVGGALRMNAGAMGAWIFDAVEEVEFVTLAGELVRRRASELHVGYRHCAELAAGAIATGALLRSGVPVDAESVSRQIDVYRKKRVESQPREPSAGCIFKNPEGDSAGRLIDAAGLKGLRVGGAEVSTVHANFIVNKAHATAAEVLELVRQVRARVQAVHGVLLEPEARLFGKDWAAVLEETFDWQGAGIRAPENPPLAAPEREGGCG